MDLNNNGNKKTVFVTGSAGFIGFHLSKRLLETGWCVCGLDNLNDYYDVRLKESRLIILKTYKNFRFIKGDISNQDKLMKIFQTEKPEIVINLAAQAGVRYSIENPGAYIDSNIVGFFNVLECCRKFPVKHLLFASSSSVYGANKKIPYSTADPADHPVSLYAATKKSNELMAYCYSKLYDIPATGLRFFTVYGPFGRPDMAYFSFTKKILAGETVEIFNQGDMYRDFTYIDDIINGIEKMLEAAPPCDDNEARYKVYNIGNNHPERILDFVQILEKQLGRSAVTRFLPMQQGDVFQTCADIGDLIRDFDFKPKTNLEEGLSEFVRWYREYYP